MHVVCVRLLLSLDDRAVFRTAGLARRTSQAVRDVVLAAVAAMVVVLAVGGCLRVGVAAMRMVGELGDQSASELVLLGTLLFSVDVFEAVHRAVVYLAVVAVRRRLAARLLALVALIVALCDKLLRLLAHLPVEPVGEFALLRLVDCIPLGADVAATGEADLVVLDLLCASYGRRRCQELAAKVTVEIY